MAGYVFLSNSTKPSEEEQNSKNSIKLTNVSRPCLQTAIEMGYDVYFGTNRANPEKLECELPVKMYDSHSYRSITAFKDNKIAYDNLAKVVKEGNIDVIHCNTPVGGLVGRLVGHRYKVKKILYTAHGFHFFKGAPLFNRTVLKWAEQIMAHWTDAIITMNEEDYQSALKFRLKKGGKVFKVHGVGITLSDFINPENRVEKRTELGLRDDDIMLISAGDLVERKNYGVAIEAIAKGCNKKLHYFICGNGPELENLKSRASELGVSEQIHFLGFRSDIKDLMYAADIFLFTTLQEGLPRSMMEAMACGLPCVASAIRGNVDLLDDGKGGYLCGAKDIDSFADKIQEIAVSESVRRKMKNYNLEAIRRYDVSVVKTEIANIYKDILGENVCQN
ncbi:glycosyltransferase family 4 protein [Enterococcus faecium]|uniref:glycosyltransferase family 4 protein n=1 Tax=Enterococcus faecium TaxID=1352 RepID=UPI0029529D45|nr:glycosyltransferase family 4 protein [Enterococcus faecium]MDV7750680.1 glycosyltransferase family 4 protein [Enterococcus faecium]